MTEVFDRVVDSPETLVRKAFSQYMESAKMQILFQDALPDCQSGTWLINDCEIQHPRYKTYLNPASRDKSFLALAYHLTGINIPLQTPDNRILYAKVYLGTRSQTEYDQLVASTGDDPHQAVLHLAKYGLLAWFFPVDPVMLWLPKLVNVNVMRGYFCQFLTIQTQDLHDLHINIVNYRPEIRCTFRYDLRTFYDVFCIYGKSLADGHGEEIFNRINYFYQRGQINSDHFVMAKPLGYDPELKTIWLQGVAGKSLIETLNDQNADRLMSRIARYLVDFQDATLTGLAVISEADQLTELQKKALKLQRAFPALSKRIATLVTKLSEQQPTLPLIVNRLIHGDFHLQQLLLLPDERIALFDFDELALANPLTDIANFAADLYNFNFSQDFTARLIHRLFTAYQAESVITIHYSHFVWHLRVQLLTRAYRAYIQQKPQLEHLMARFLVAAEVDQ